MGDLAVLVVAAAAAAVVVIALNLGSSWGWMVGELEQG